jgi:Rrf2 family protein
MLSQTAEYALRAAVCLAMRPGESLSVAQMSAQTKVPSAYLAKVLQSLAKAGVVTSQRGMRGGFSLTKSPHETTIYDVVQAVEPFQRITRCPLGLPGHVKLCPLHKRVDEAMAGVEEAFRSTNLGELLNERAASIPLCDASMAVLQR